MEHNQCLSKGHPSPGAERKGLEHAGQCLQSPPRPQHRPSWAVSQRGEENRLHRRGSNVPRREGNHRRSPPLVSQNQAQLTDHLLAAHLTTACPSSASGYLNAPAHFTCREQPGFPMERSQEVWVLIPAPLMCCEMEGEVWNLHIPLGEQVMLPRDAVSTGG